MRIFLICILIIIFPELYAQAPIAEQKIGWRGSGIELHSISDKDKGQVCTVILNYDSVKAFVLNSSMQWTAPFNMARRTNEKMLGGFFRNGKIYLFLDNGNEPGLHVWALIPETGEKEQYMVNFETGKEKIIDYISCGDHFLFFTFNRKTYEFIIHDFTDEANYITAKHKFDPGVWRELTSVKGLGRYMDAEKIDMEGDCSVEIAASKTKIYVRNDTLYLILNRTKGYSKVFSFSLRDQQVEVKNIFHKQRDKTVTGEVAFADNSFLLHDKLYYVHASPNALGIQVVDINSGNVSKTFLTPGDQEIPFRNTPIIQEGTDYFKGMKRELDKTSQLLRKMTNGGAVIMASINSQKQVEVTVGSFKEVTQSYGGAPGMRTTSMAGTSVTVMTHSGHFSRNSWTKSARFKILLDPISSEHIEGEMNQSINEQIEEYTKDIKIPAQAENLFVCSGRSYYAFYDKKQRKLNIVGF